jgi:predicted SprT family Zn-dependent metalloprotease
MDIYEALEKLDGFFDMLANYGECTDEELDLMGEIEDVIYQFARKYEPRAEDLPVEFTCDCGTHMTRNRITNDGNAEFICSKCNAVWLLDRSF